MMCNIRNLGWLSSCAVLAACFSDTPMVTSSSGSGGPGTGSSGAATGSTSGSGSGSGAGDTTSMGSNSGSTSSAGSSSSTGASGSGTGGGVCGDSNVDPGEACDDGVNAGMTVGDCAPDCSKLVDKKFIRVSKENSTISGLVPGNTPKDKIASLDAICANDFGADYRAMFAIDGARKASNTANTGDGAVDWVLQPWTEYHNDDGKLVWRTDEVALLGVDNGFSAALLSPIQAMPAFNVATGMNPDWATLTDSAKNCSDWSSMSGSDDLYVGFSSNSMDGEFLYFDAPFGCDESAARIYCAEQ